MGFLDALLGGRNKLKGSAPDRLFAMTTAYVAMQIELDVKSAGSAGLVFQPLATSDFTQILHDAKELLEGMAGESDSKLETADDEFGYRWMILRDDDFEDLVVALNTISTELQNGGYGDRLLCAVFAFEEQGRRMYLIYNYKRGSFYPFVPAGGEQHPIASGEGHRQRDTERELRLKSQLENELPFEPETTRWFPLWEIPL